MSLARIGRIRAESAPTGGSTRPRDTHGNDQAGAQDPRRPPHRRGDRPRRGHQPRLRLPDVAVARARRRLHADEGRRASLLWTARGGEDRARREASAGRRGSAGQGPRRRGQSARLALHARRAVHHASRSGVRPAEGPAARRRFLGHGRGRRQERHDLQARGRGVRREERRVRRVRRRERGTQRPDKARAHHVRAGGGRADRGRHRAAGPARQGRARRRGRRC